LTSFPAIKLKIAVTNTGREDRQRFYRNWLQSFNAKAELVVASYWNGFAGLDSFDGLVLSGGEDIDPKFSKAEPLEFVNRFNTRRDEFEFKLLDDAFKKNMPVLCICRGMQLVNVFLDGTLIADLSREGFDGHNNKGNGVRFRSFESRIQPNPKCGTFQSAEQKAGHPISVSEATVLNSIVGVQSGDVNSFHHQGVKKIADDLAASSIASDGIAESLEWKEKEGKSFLLGVQWHPERMRDKESPFAQKIGEAFFQAVKNFRR